MHTSTLIHRHAHRQTYTQTHPCTRTHTDASAHISTHTHTHTHTHAHTRTLTHSRTHAHTLSHTHTFTHTYTLTHTLTHATHSHTLLVIMNAQIVSASGSSHSQRVATASVTIHLWRALRSISRYALQTNLHYTYACPWINSVLETKTAFTISEWISASFGPYFDVLMKCMEIHILVYKKTHAQ